MDKKMMPMMIFMAVLFIASLVFAGIGFSMHQKVAVEEAKFHALQDEYFNITKIQRDTAPANSELNAKLVQIQNYPSELLGLKLVGVGRILTGIYILLAGILLAIIMMPVRLAKMIR